MAHTFNLDPATLEGRLGKIMMDAMNKEIAAVAEPIIQKALDDIQIKMKARLGSVAVSLMSTGFNIERFGDDLRIVVQVREPKP